MSDFTSNKMTKISQRASQWIFNYQYKYLIIIKKNVVKKQVEDYHRDTCGPVIQEYLTIS